jgi:hypothetical protein
MWIFKPNSRFPVLQSTQTQFDSVLFWVQFKIDLKKFKPLVLNSKFFNQIFAAHFFFLCFWPKPPCGPSLFHWNSPLASPSACPICSTLRPNLAHLGIVFLALPRAAVAAIFQPYHHPALRRAALAIRTEEMSHRLTILLFCIEPKLPHHFDSPWMKSLRSSATGRRSPSFLTARFTIPRPIKGVETFPVLHHVVSHPKHHPFVLLSLPRRAHKVTVIPHSSLAQSASPRYRWSP